MTAGRLAQLIGLTTGALTGVIDRLERAGLVDRQRDLHDRGKVIVRLLADSARVARIEAIYEPLTRAFDEACAHYTNDERATLLDVFPQTRAQGAEREAKEDDGQARQ